MDLCEGRPKDTSNRVLQEIRSYDLLDSLDIKYSCVDHEAADTMEVCLERSKVLGTRICKNLFLCNRQETAFYLLIMPADKIFKTSIVSKQLGVSRLHFADELYIKKYLDIKPGSVSVLGLMNDLENKVCLLMDKEIITQEYFACHPCINTSSLKFKTSDLIDKILPSIGHKPILIEL